MREILPWNFSTVGKEKPVESHSLLDIFNVSLYIVIFAFNTLSCVHQVRNFLETTLSELREMWMKRITYKATVACTCDKPCLEHERQTCTDNQCLHFLLLDECLANKVPLCLQQKNYLRLSIVELYQ